MTEALQRRSRRLFVLFGVSSVLLLLLAGGVWAQQCCGRGGQGMGGPGMMMGMDPGGCGGCCIMRLESLTDEQRDDIAELEAACKKDCISLGAEVATLSVDLHALMQSDDPDPSKVESLARRIGETEGRLHARHLRLQLDMKKVLTPEQREELKTLCRGHQCSGAGCHGSRGCGHSCGGGMGMGGRGCCQQSPGACRVEVKRFLGGDADPGETMRGSCRRSSD